MNYFEIIQSMGAVSGLVCLLMVILSAKKQLKAYCKRF